MTTTRRIALLFANAGLLLGCSSSAPARANDTPATGVAVVELFTSEGCSSCPPADAAVGDLIRAHRGGPVYVLAFHVDYWDDLGWTDPFSQKTFTDRQNAYRQSLHLQSIYTPQAVVNGRTELVGSNRTKLWEAVASGLATPTSGTVAAAITGDAATVKAAITATSLPPGTLIHIAIVQATASTEVPRGENGGRTLKHDNIVRAFVSVPLDAGGRASATLIAPHGGWPKEGSAIVFAQGPADGQVLAATEVRLPQ